MSSEDVKESAVRKESQVKFLVPVPHFGDIVSVDANREFVSYTDFAEALALLRQQIEQHDENGDRLCCNSYRKDPHHTECVPSAFLAKWEKVT